ncbi:MAG: geranylgeranyl reductase family protein [Chloroflexi bacterium]|nr:geranylgeranyl reductase family protein [Chloroflexota bacterium]
MNFSHDVIVIGAGPGGSSVAHFLAQGGARVLLLDKAKFPRGKTCGDGLTPRAVQMLDEMGLLGELSAQRRSIRRFEVIAPNRRMTMSPIPDQVGRNGQALVIPRMELDARLLQRAVESGAEFRSNVHALRVAGDGRHATVHVEHGGHNEVWTAPLAVIAIGANMRLLLDSGILKRIPETMIAARAYFENLCGLSDAWQLRFDGVPLPGYGWIFPIDADTANIGAGFFGNRRSRTSADAFTRFIANPALQPLLARAKQIGPTKSYPLRADFTTAPTHAPNVLLVGEAAGLVNPLTGEGIDYALESGRIAAQHITGMLARNDFSTAALNAYDAALRAQFQSLFEFCIFVRDHMCDKAWLLNALVAMANQRADLRARLATVVLGGQTIHGKFTMQRALRAIFKPT